MNRRIWLACVLCGGVALGQANSGATAPAKAMQGDDEQKASSAAAASTIAMDDPVLTIRGFCPERKSASAAGATALCETVITRAQFEKIAGAIRPNLSASVKQQLASLYPRLLVTAHAAEEMGLDKQAPYEEMIAFSRMQILTQGLTRKLQESSTNVSDREIAEYYQNNPDVSEEYTLLRLVVPLRKQGAMPKTADKRSGGDEAQQRDLAELAEKLRARAAAGENFLKLQREAFDAAGITVASPTTSMGKVRRAALPATQTAIFQLKVGEVSPVISDSGGHYIYKLEGKDHLTMEQVKGEIRQTLESQHGKQAMDKIQASYTTELNEAYFAPPPAKREQ